MKKDVDAGLRRHDVERSGGKEAARMTLNGKGKKAGGIAFRMGAPGTESKKFFVPGAPSRFFQKAASSFLPSFLP